MGVLRSVEHIVRRGVTRALDSRSQKSAGKPIDRGRIRSILLVRVDRIGDVIISAPTIRLLRHTFPNARIDIVLGEKNRRIAPLISGVDETLLWERNPISLISTIGRLRRGRWDLVLDLHLGTSGNGGLVAALAGGDNIITVDPVSIPSGEHVVRSTSRVLARLGIAPLLADADEAENRLTLKFHGSDAPKDHRPTVAVNLSAGGPDREWPIQHMRTLAEQLSADGLEVRLLIRPGDEEKVSAIPMPLNCLPVSPTTDLGSFLRILSTMDAIVTPDCGTVHLAAAAGVSVVGLFKDSATAARWRPWGVPYRLHCAEDGDLSSIAVEDVFDSTIDLIAQQQAKR